MARGPRVYLIAQPTINRQAKLPKLEPLSEYGEVFTVVRSGDNPTFNPGRVLGIVFHRMKDFDAKLDYLVWAGGDTLAATMAGIVLERMQISEVRWLRYERKKLPNGQRTDEGARYVPVKVTIYEALQGEGQDRVSA